MFEAYREVLKFKNNILLDEISELNLPCKSIIEDYLLDNNKEKLINKLKIQAVIDYTYEQINIGNWKEVKLFLRKTMTIASYLKLLVHLKSYESVDNDIIKEAYKIIDFGILFGCPIDKDPKLLQNCASVLNKYLLPQNNSDLKLQSEDNSSEISNIPDNNAILLNVLKCPSMEYFYTNCVLAEKPAILTNCIDHWPALQKWKNQEYIINLAGMRTVSVEIGSKYTDSDWTQKLMTIEEFVKNYIYQSDGLTGYLAQYQLFDQIPELKTDISEPEYCCFSDTDEPVDVMSWYGPKGTVSPLHHDPKRNLLAQVVGEKRVYLFSPKDSEYLYPHEHELLNNTAQVDPRKPDLEKYPNYKSAKAYYCILKPGQLLYIPPKWWHFVESLSISFSVSFWWT